MALRRKHLGKRSKRRAARKTEDERRKRTKRRKENRRMKGNAENGARRNMMTPGDYTTTEDMDGGEIDSRHSDSHYAAKPTHPKKEDRGNGKTEMQE